MPKLKNANWLFSKRIEKLNMDSKIQLLLINYNIDKLRKEIKNIVCREFLEDELSQ